MNPEDVPADLLAPAMQAWDANAPGKGGNWSAEQQVRAVIAAVLPVHERQVMTRLFGTREEVAAREAEAAQRAPDDTVRLCEMARPGEHERRVRERVTAEIEAERSGGTEHWSIAMDHAARIARGESR